MGDLEGQDRPDPISTMVGPSGTGNLRLTSFQQVRRSILSQERRNPAPLATCTKKKLGRKEEPLLIPATINNYRRAIHLKNGARISLDVGLYFFRRARFGTLKQDMIYIIRHHRRLEIKVRFIALLIQACCRIVGYDYLFFYEVRNHLLLAALLIIIR
uniref:Uncharacterized mitochondrial protein AtMg00400 n=1 Tax=Arabidopsis thaliana TaxID=3702 RepID=M400_ARATH|nr:RecName: Full=Uncharacterized mitochondrial protein AtMg00400; AltName: Full=ORF157 [Arabidopsis thaliana]CAA69777.1 unnamed protein product [Arabidopsis thaliana]